MSERYPGGLIRKTPPTVTGPATSGPLAGEGGSASGVWTLADVLTYEKVDGWPKPVLPRSLYAWGQNNNGQLGQNNLTYRSSPVQVGALTDWATSSTVSGGSSLAIKTNGTLWAWGNNGDGQLGQNDRVNRSSPVQVGALTNWGSVKGGDANWLAVKTDGTLWACGQNSVGKLGDGTAITRSSPVQIGALTNWRVASPTGDSCSAIKTDGTLWTWGSANNGVLGSNAITPPRSSPVQVGALTDWFTLSTGNRQTFAVKTSGQLWAWGYNRDGALGDGTSANRSSPVQIGALTNWSGTFGGSQFCAAVKTDGTLWMWGYNTQGQLGQSDVVSRSSPVQVGSLTNWSVASAGNRQALAVKTDGTLWAWGQGVVGELGDGTTVNKSSPVQIGSLATWSSVGVGFGSLHGLAITKG